MVPDEPLRWVQGDTGPNPVFHFHRSSPTAGASPIDLASLATAFMRIAGNPSGATAYLVPATVASGASPAAGLVEAWVGSGPAGVFATAGRYIAQVVLVGPWGRESWPSDQPYDVTITPRVGGV